MSLHVDGAEGTAWAEVLTGPAAYAHLLVDHGDEQCLLTRNGLVVGIEPAPAVEVDPLHERHHLYGLCRTLACTQSASLAVAHRDAEVACPHCVSHLYGSALLHGHGLYGTGGANLAAAVALRPAVTTFIAHLGLHQAVGLAAGAQHVIGTSVDAQLACDAVLAHVACRERTRRRNQRLPLGLLLLLYQCQTAVGGLVLGMEQGCGCQHGHRCEHSPAPVVHTALCIGLVLDRRRGGGCRFLGGTAGRLECAYPDGSTGAGILAVAAHHAAAHVHRVALTVDAGALATAGTQAATVAAAGINHWAIQRASGYQAEQRAHGTRRVAPGAAAPPCQHTYDQQRYERYHQRRKALHPHIHAVEGIAVIVLGQAGQGIVAHLVERCHQTSHYPAIGAIGHQQRRRPAEVEHQHQAGKCQACVAQDVPRLAVSVLEALPAEPCDGILHHTQGADDRTIDAPQQQGERYDEEQRPHIEGQHSGHELYAGHPSQIGVSRPCEVEQQPGDEHPEHHGKRCTDFAKHDDSVWINVTWGRVMPRSSHGYW